MSNDQYIERYWRDATPQDAIKEPPMVARFKDHHDELWIRVGKLFCWDRSDDPWVNENHWRHNFCQVYDAPDPGEGWRLIDPHKDEPQEGDEFYLFYNWTSGELLDQSEWAYCNNFLTGVRYTGNQLVRRRIEQLKPEPRYEPFRWEDREQLRGRWIGSNNGLYERLVTVMYHKSESFDVNGISVESLCAEWHFLDTGEPVGRRVE